MSKIEEDLSNNTDLFGSLVDLESSFVAEGKAEGIRVGKKIGRYEGFDLGYKKGDEIGTEIGYYKGCLVLWSSIATSNPR
jgi:hypothetical protein